ncbi:15715_t:CDS:1 [Acaulospora colombiana]|uniref:15715_t:CDS:1 n=1 Tax=Acaulospora colombiana TaxID=27376 RepID=A0ACA9MBE0_9GLOM|nr:15715_t:CDS:1 [Acaulospora colombiana]
MSRRPQGRKFQNQGDELKKRSATQNPKKSRSIPITVPSETSDNFVKVSPKTAVLDKKQASKKIYKFLRNNTANHKTRNVLSKLLQLRKIQNHLINLESQNDQVELTFDTEQETPQVLPTSKSNKKFLEYEDTVMRTFDKLDGIDSNGCEIVRERRKEVVTLAQGILNRLDRERENQWKELKRKVGKSDMVTDENITIGNNVSDNNTTVEKRMTEDNIIIGEGKGEEEKSETVVSEDIEVDDVENDINQSPLESHEETEIIPYVISEADEIKKIVQNDDISRGDTAKDIEMDVIPTSMNGSMDVDEPFMEENSNTDFSSSFAEHVNQEVSNEERINFDEEKSNSEDEFVMIESNDSN